MHFASNFGSTVKVPQATAVRKHCCVLLDPVRVLTLVLVSRSWELIT